MVSGEMDLSLPFYHQELVMAVSPVSGVTTLALLVFSVPLLIEENDLEK